MVVSVTINSVFWLSCWVAWDTKLNFYAGSRQMKYMNNLGTLLMR